MSTLAPASRLHRVNQAIQVLAILFEFPDTSIVDACNQIGIEPRTFYRWVHKGETTIDSLREFIAHQQKEILIHVSAGRQVAVQHLINDAVHENTSTRDRIMALRYLDEVREALERAHHAAPGIEEDAHAFLKQGPKTSKMKSRLASIEVRETDDGIDLEIYKEQDVIVVNPRKSPQTQGDDQDDQKTS